jgi:hypothetical protein
MNMPFLSFISATAQGQFIQTRYAVYIQATWQNSESSTHMGKTLEIAREVQINQKEKKNNGSSTCHIYAILPYRVKPTTSSEYQQRVRDESGYAYNEDIRAKAGSSPFAPAAADPLVRLTHRRRAGFFCASFPIPNDRRYQSERG